MNKMLEILDKAYAKLIPDEKTARDITERYMKMYNLKK